MGDVAAVGVQRNNTSGPVWARGPHRAGARRCLFGAPDPEKTREFLQSETERIADENRLKWNFDFVAEKPLDCGRFAWTQVSEVEQKDVEKDKVQTRITDFMRKRKLPNHPNNEPSSSEDEPTSSEHPKDESKSSEHSEDEPKSSEEPPTKSMRRFST